MGKHTARVALAQIISMLEQKKHFLTVLREVNMCVQALCVFLYAYTYRH